MRTLLALTALMLLLATAVWWKTQTTDEATNLPPTTQEDPYGGVVTLGTQGKTSLAEASFPKTSSSTQKSDGNGDHEARQDSQNEDALPEPPADIAPTPPAKPDPIVEVPTGRAYIIQSGDTLYRILVRAYGTAPEELIDAIAEANAMSDPSALTVGATLKLPLVSGFQPPQQP